MSKAFKTQLQVDKHCCDCGTLMPKNQMTIISTTSVEVNFFLIGHLIAWCDPCWKKFAGVSGDSIEVIDTHAKAAKIPA